MRTTDTNTLQLRPGELRRHRLGHVAATGQTLIIIIINEFHRDASLKKLQGRSITITVISYISLSYISVITYQLYHS